MFSKLEDTCFGVPLGIYSSCYAVLIQTLQSGWNEAYAFTNMESERLDLYMEVAQTLLKGVKRWKSGLPVPFEFEDALGFYTNRAFMLEMILERVGQPFQGAIYS